MSFWPKVRTKCLYYLPNIISHKEDVTSFGMTNPEIWCVCSEERLKVLFFTVKTGNLHHNWGKFVLF